MDPLLNFNPKSVEEVFLQFKGRRTALLSALTKAQNWKLCLIGHPGERWEVNIAEEEMHVVLPQPLRGINFGRDRMDKREWLTMLALHSDTWLLRVAFNFSSRFRHDKADRSRLFDMINELPTILEVVSGKAVEPPKHNPKLRNDDSNKPKIGGKHVNVSPTGGSVLDGQNMHELKETFENYISFNIS
ncbi:PREDICTED: PHD finger protein ALFIN-LIKE 4-like [Ipomoea nil]|uniref:PHD finger protein ALFIN-LIKE 4-like n=1 Tax=Ipomoea nil TaxID=35883 RepID=UPI0009018162|nr:PREDICTED: PHD finger protein ALFIN-LIKE 4-like [Ipomoea nil]